jgi:sugar/nucleoside kinase (ribokinase family)
LGNIIKKWRIKMEDKKLDLLSVGDVTMDVFMTPTESEALCHLDDKDALICFSYGEKIPVKTIEQFVGGNAANNAVGTTRLGIRTGLVSTLGGDSIGNQIVEKLEREGVDLGFIVQQPEAGSNYSTIINYGGERTIFSYHAPRSYEFPVHLPVTSWIYLTSMGESFQPFYNHFVDFVRKNPQVKLAFNPGSRQLRAGNEALEPIMKYCHVIYVNRKEAQKLTGMKDSQGKDKELLKALSEKGPKIVIITAGGDGSFVYDSINEKYYRAGVLPIDAHERTGAGDSFGAGCISALVKGKTFEEALLWGTVNAASVIGYTGSQKGLLKEDEMPIWLERAKSCNVEVGEF